MSRPHQILLFTLFILLASASITSNAEDGKKLHDTHCQACHVGMTGGDGSLLYTRDNRRVTSLEKLENQVRRCESNLELKWFDEDINNVVEFLNANYYHFDKKK